MQHLYELGDFVRSLRIKFRFGELSRAPLRLLRIELCGNVAECDWVARPPDAWDADLPAWVRQRNASRQALIDASAVRDLLFMVLPDLESAHFRVYRHSDGPQELIINGTVTRGDSIKLTTESPAMRAKLHGLQFRLEDGILHPVHIEDAGIGS